ncbi:MAG: hypothetical protein KC516_00865 [Nanoarchaeota archaeon]|nr:hypothetical protein [Nanoarchaeota archaeon]
MRSKIFLLITLGILAVSFASSLDLSVSFKGYSNLALGPTASVNQSDYFPLTSPYGTGETIDVNFLNKYDVLDWILVELREEKNSSFLFAESYLALADGRVIDVNGKDFSLPKNNEYYYIFIDHRNHLSIVSDEKYGYYTPPTASVSSGLHPLLIPGDADGNEIIQNTDYTNFLVPQNNSEGYLEADFNFDGIVNQEDEDLWSDNLGLASQAGKFSFAPGLKVFLEGPYEGVSMKDGLAKNGFLPMTSPYGTGETIDQNFIDSHEIVDWILIELRTERTSDYSVLESALLLKNGFVIDTTGERYSLPSEGEYYIIVDHRNHLAIMSENKYSSNDPMIDLTLNTSIYKYLNGAKEVSSGVYALIAGDSDGNEIIQNSDNNYTVSQLGQAGYLEGDLDLNGFVQNTDLLNFWTKNLGFAFQVPAYDFCGDSVCSVTENCSICSVDCGSCSLSVTPSGPTTEDNGGRGGSCIYNDNFDWQCSEWSDCVNGTQTRTCKPYNNCGNTYGRPLVEQACQTIIPSGELLNETEINPRRAGITGAVIGDYLSSGRGIVSIIAILIALGGIGYFGVGLARDLKNKKKE